jgi:hypothetical protein
MVDMTAMALPPYVQSVSYGANDFYVSSSYADGFDTEAIKVILHTTWYLPAVSFMRVFVFVM